MESTDNLNPLTLSQNFSQEVHVQDDFKAVKEDIMSSIKNWRLWTYMAVAELKRRYRRTMLGPFWTTLNLAIFIGCMGLLLSSLWKTDTADFLPFFCSGFVAWSLISAIFTEGCNTFTTAEGLLKQLPIPYTTFSFFVVSRNYVVFFHHLIILLLVLLIFKVPFTVYNLLVIPGLALLFVTGSCIATLLGLVCSRFRDIQQIVTSVLQLSMFVTPIFWKPGQMGRRGVLLADLNPLYHLVDIIRSPLIGEAPSLLSYGVVVTIALVGWILTLYVFSKSYRKLIFWL